MNRIAGHDAPSVGRGPLAANVRVPWLVIAAVICVAASAVLLFRVLGAAATPTEVSAVESFQQNSELIRIACLDVNSDGQLNASDAVQSRASDITGDGKVDESDLSVIRQTNLTVPGGRPKDCGSRHPTDWEVGPPAAIDCSVGRGGFIILGIGGGGVDLSTSTDAAGVRWMQVEISKVLTALAVPNQLISVSPGLAGTEAPQPDAETWTATYVEQQLEAYPCLRVILLGHSHGGTGVTAIASRLENAGFAKQIGLSVLIDRVTVLYAGDTTSIPQSSLVFNIYLSTDEEIKGHEIDQPNVENWNATHTLAPEHGEQGGALMPVTHTTVDNSLAALDQIVVRILPLIASP
jgi:hypothetical protein